MFPFDVRFRRPRRLPAPSPSEQARAIDVLERDGVLLRSEAHALRAGDRLGDLYAEIFDATGSVSIAGLDEIEALIRVGDLIEAVIEIGRLHPALRDFPALVQRRTGRG